MAPSFASSALEDIQQSEYPSVHAFVETNYILKILGSGSYATVYASIPKNIADQILTRYKASDRSSQAVDEACSNLRSAIQAVKVASNDPTTKDRKFLTSEIEHLRYIRGLGTSNLPTLLEFDRQELKSWYTLKPLNGGTLHQYASRGYSPRINVDLQLLFPPVSFAWHVIAQLAEALCLFQFGIASNQRLHFHSDMSQNNIMFNYSPTTETAYPDAYITDFGCSSSLDFSTASTLDKDFFFYKQRKDVEGVILYCKSLFRPEERGLIEQIFEDFRKLPKKGKHHDCLKRWLQKLARTARKVRNERYEPLSERTASYFARPLVSNEELLEVFKILRKKPRSQNCDIL